MPITTSSVQALALYEQASYLAWNGEHVAALDLIDSALEFDSTFAAAYTMRALLTRTPADLERALELSVNHPPEERKMIEAYYMQVFKGDKDAAGHLFKELREKYPDDLDIRLTNLVLLREHDLADAFAEMELIKRDFPTVPLVYNQFGYLYIMKGEMDRAEQAFQTYIRLAPHTFNPYDSMGDLLRSEGRYEEAINYYQQAMSRDVARFSLNRLVLCQAFLEKFDKAWHEIDLARPILAENPYLYHDIALKLTLSRRITNRRLNTHERRLLSRSQRTYHGITATRLSTWLRCLFSWTDSTTQRICLIQLTVSNLNAARVPWS